MINPILVIALDLLSRWLPSHYRMYRKAHVH